MICSMDEALALYMKIRTNTATKDEQTRFDLIVGTSCMDSKLLLDELDRIYKQQK